MASLELCIQMWRKLANAVHSRCQWISKCDQQTLTADGDDKES